MFNLSLGVGNNLIVDPKIDDELFDDYYNEIAYAHITYYYPPCSHAIFHIWVKTCGISWRHMAPSMWTIHTNS